MSIAIWLPIPLSAQPKKATDYPQDYFGAPLDTPLQLSATFGDLRSNHFHSGIDLRTNNEEGKNVYAAADGWVVRIKVSAFGYGKAIYIAHPNGYTTVYAHLKEYNEVIEQYVLRRQKARESFEVDLFPAGTELKVKKGQIIALSGNTGGSTGPHLHFEIRDSRTEAIINPLLFGLKINDAISPEIAGIRLNKIEAGYRAESGQFRYFNLKRNTAESPMPVAMGEYGVMIDAADYFTESTRRMSWNLATLELNGNLIWKMDLERFQFHETRLINTHLDYHLLKAKKEKWVKMWGDDGNTLPFYQWSASRGKINIREGETYALKITVSDLAGHKDSAVIYLAGTGREQTNTTQDSRQMTYCTPEAGGKISTKHYEVIVPPGALYFPVALSIKADTGNAAPVIKLLPENIALNKSITIKLKPAGTMLNRTSALLIAATVNGLSSIGGSYDDGWVEAESKDWGSFTIAEDVTDPTIKLISRKPLAFEIKDDLSGIASYRCTIDGQWTLMEYDAKNNRLQIHSSAQPKAATQQVTLVVKDKKGRKATFKQVLTFE